MPVRALAVVGVRRTPVAAIAAAGVVAGAGVVARAAAADEPAEMLTFVRVSAILVAAAATAAVDDPSAPLTDTTWRGRRLRAAFVLVPTAVLAALVWSVPALATRWIVAGPALPITGLLVELAGLTIVGWLLTSAYANVRGTHGASLAGATTLMVLALGTMSVPRTMAWLWRSPDPDWTVSHVRWGTVIGAATLGLVALWRDPAR
jgi:hypothetical protein